MPQSTHKLLAESLIRDVPDFPAPGILFKDITPVLGDPVAFAEIIDRLAEVVAPLKPDVVAGIESRGFIFGTPLALKLGVGFAPIRKAGKLPYELIREEYLLEYGASVVEMHVDAVKPGQRVVTVDDLLATGGTARAAIKLIERLGAEVVAAAFVIELEFLNGRELLPNRRVESLIKF